VIARLMVFTENYARGGGNRYMIDLVNAIAHEFDEVVLVSNPGGIFAEDVARLAHPAVKIDTNFVSRETIFRRAPGLVRAGRMFRAALSVLEPLLFFINIARFMGVVGRLHPSRVLVCNGGYPASHACIAMVTAARLRRCPAALSIVSMPSRRRSYLWLFEWLLDRLTWRSAAPVIVNARTIAEALGGFRGMPSGLAKVIHNGIEECVSGVSWVHDPALVVIGCVARLDSMKGVLVLLDSFTVLAAECPAVRLVLAGEGDATHELQRRVEDRGLQDRVQFLGHFSGDVNALLRSFDIFVFPSLWEGLPYSILEALRAGCAIVATDVGGIPEAITDGLEGLLVRAGDPVALAAGLRKLNDPELRQTLSKAARDRFVREFSLEQMHRRVRTVMRGTA